MDLAMINRLQQFLFLGIITVTGVKVASSLRWYGHPGHHQKQAVASTNSEPADWTRRD